MALLLRWLQTATLLAVCIDAALGQAPPDLRAGLEQAQSHMSGGDFGQAESVLDGLARAHPDNGEVHFRLGLILLRREEIEGANRHLEMAAKLTPNSPIVWLSLARSRLQNGNAEGAEEAAERADSLAPQHPAIGQALAILYAEAGDFEKAASYEKRRYDAEPQDASSAMRMAEFSLRSDDAETALAAAERAAALEDNGGARFLLGKAARAMGDPRRAVEELQKAIVLDAQQPVFYAELAGLFLEHRTADPAAIILERAVELFPANAELWRLLGVARYASGQKLEAIDAFLRITELEPDSEVGYVSLETLLPDAGERMGEIIRRLRGFCKRRPTAVGFHLLALSVAIQDPDDAEPTALLRRAIELDPDFWPAYFELHKSLLLVEDYAAATATLERTVALRPDYAPAHFALAQIYTRTGKREQAAKERGIHHELINAQREATQLEREAAPRLPVQIVE